MGPTVSRSCLAFLGFFLLVGAACEPTGAHFDPYGGVLTVYGTAAADVVTVSVAAGAVVVNGGQMPIQGGVPTAANTTRIVLHGREGADFLELDEAGGPLPDGRLFGGPGADVLVGGSGDDEVDGGPDDDIVLLGPGDDAFVWGEGGGVTDTIEGEEGTDRARFVGNTGDEHVEVVAVNGRVLFYRNAGDVETMRALGEQYGFAVEVVDDACAISESGRRWSSTWVRELLDKGDLPGAAEVLGRPHRLRGHVVHGDKLGREIGFPTANIEVESGMIPRHGVYAGWFTVVDPGGNPGAEAVLGEPLPAAVSLGLNYTVGGTDLRVEAFIIDREGLDLYGAEVTLDLVAWRRPMLDFGSLDALITALTEDVQWCRSVLA